MSSTVNLRSILESNKLTGNNFLDWLRNLRIVLKAERLAYVLDEAFPEPLPEDASEDQVLAYKKRVGDDELATCIMLASMSSELQKQHEAMDAYTIIYHLRELFDEQARTERFDISRSLFRSKMQEGTSVVQHALKMNGYIERLAALGFTMDHELSIDLILQSLPDSYSQFIMNYQMNQISSTIPELINLLKTAEPSIKKDKQTVMLVDSSKKKSSSKKIKPIAAKGGVKKKAKAAEKAASKGTCFHCGKNGHWKRNCKAYLESLKKQKASDAGATSGMFVIEINTVSNKTWVLDTRCGSHI